LARAVTRWPLVARRQPPAYAKPVMGEQHIVVFTDGASKGNPGPGGWGVVIARPDGHVMELGGGVAMTTNNKMELTAAIQALEALRGTSGPVDIYTDSTYVIQGIRGWVYGWKRRGWKTVAGSDVLNRELWERLDALASAMGSRRLTWHYVRGHVGTPGNERVDEIADSFAMQRPVALYDGPLSGYPIPILDLPLDTALPSRSDLSSSGAASKGAYSYLSVVDGKPMRHATWRECEQRVKGRSGARFRKAASAAEEESILRSWHCDPDDL
jgi:ribonuclease HI